jgi:limonene-1,2-epoxide hydrolase
MLDCIVADDRDAASALFAKDGIYHVQAWNEPIVGREAIHAELERQAGIYSGFHYEILNIASTTAVVFTERLDRMTIGGREICLHWASVHEIDSEGSIAVVRDYYDVKELEARLI